jgi:FKBP-type peptidyl-prolyl cis-trans isomerase SlpA
MKAGDSKTTTIPPERGYGLREQGFIFKAPRTAFQYHDQLNPGDVVSGQRRGQAFRAIVAEVGPEEITLDLNHPLAGKTLQFEVKILEIA